jgi:hypothetical protein
MLLHPAVTAAETTPETLCFGGRRLGAHYRKARYCQNYPDFASRHKHLSVNEACIDNTQI